MSDTDYTTWVAAVRTRLREARLALGLSYRAAGERTGVPFQTITRVETAKVVPTAEIVFKLAAGYGVPVRDVMFGAQRKPGAPRAKPKQGKY